MYGLVSSAVVLCYAFHINYLICYIFYFDRKKIDDEDEFLIESFDGNMLREWRAVPDMPWSYSRMSRVFEDKNHELKTPRKALVVTGNVNLHSPSLSKAVAYDCRMSMSSGRLIDRNCLGKTRRRIRKKRTFGPLR